MMIIENKFDIKQIVYLVTDEDQKPRIVTRLNITLDSYTYELTHGANTSWHYEFEISAGKNVMMTTTN
jgi:hypothetical protein